jgi:hypothetical protein
MSQIPLDARIRTESPPLSNRPRIRVKKHVRSAVDASGVEGSGEAHAPPFDQESDR